MLDRTVVLKYPTHRIVLTHDRDCGSVVCFKYDHSHCDFERFSDQDLESISLYIMQPLPSITWGFNLSE